MFQYTASLILAAMMEEPPAYEQQMQEEDETGEGGPMTIEQLTVR
jgi:hypothetical protein